MHKTAGVEAHPYKQTGTSWTNTNKLSHLHKDRVALKRMRLVAGPAHC